ncbi:MAG: OmpH family outer membrane protein [Acidobacteriaceae bacterium]|nr:OmpH family outer membrane protein [Acidobacteriaceae bacterium]
MYRAYLLLLALGLGLSATGAAQTAPPPQAVPAKIALISLENAVFGTNEGQRAVEDLMAKYAPRKALIDAAAAELDSLKQQLQNAPATLSDAERNNRMKAIDTKEKQLNRDTEDALSGYNSELEEIYNRLAQKLAVTLKNYIVQNGYTIVLDVNKDTNSVLMVNPANNLDITDAIIKAYNASSGIAAPASAPPAAATALAPPAAAATPQHGAAPAPLPTAPSTLTNEHYGSYVPLTQPAQPAAQK